ncbi:MAG: hypothetical protein EXS11_08925 [Gemmataceae bacterium]|nr:hypothetical protein [Gemmataceae bacterium]
MADSFPDAMPQSLNRELLFLPPYSPNLNLLERLSKFTKKNRLEGHYYHILAPFWGHFDACRGKIETDHPKERKSLMT